MVENTKSVLFNAFSLVLAVTLAFLIGFSAFYPLNLKSREVIVSADTIESSPVLASDYTPVVDSWSTKTWSGLTSFNGNYIWTDGSDYYFSNNASQYVLDKSTSTWTTKTWSGFTSFNSTYIWTDGTNYYYSNNYVHYVLNKSTSTWTSKTWSGLSAFFGDRVWSDGTNIYYSYNDSQYVLNTSTSTWTTKTWSGLTTFTGSYVWSDGTNYYYSLSSSQYVLNKSTSTWTTKTWSGLTSFSSANVWTDGINIYYSNGSSHYVLNKSTSTWTTKTWSGLTSFNGNRVWSDGTNIYYSSTSTQYFLNFSSIVSPYFTILYPSVTPPQFSSDTAVLNTLSFRLNFGAFGVSFVDTTCSVFLNSSNVSRTFPCRIRFSTSTDYLDVLPIKDLAQVNGIYVSSNDLYEFGSLLTSIKLDSDFSSIAFYPTNLTVSKSVLPTDSTYPYSGAYNTYRFLDNDNYFSFDVYYVNNSLNPYFSSNAVEPYSVGIVAGNSNSYLAGYGEGLADGEVIGRDKGYADGVQTSQQASYNEGVSAGYNDGYNAGQSAGESIGYNRGLQDANDYSFLGLIGATIDAPIQALTGLLNFEIFGVRMNDFVLALFTLAIALVIIRLAIKGGS